jgi:hypothetical protein
MHGPNGLQTLTMPSSGNRPAILAAPVAGMLVRTQAQPRPLWMGSYPNSWLIETSSEAMPSSCSTSSIKIRV